MNPFRYNDRPGKGVDPNEYQGKGVGRATRIYFRHLVEILGVNALYISFSLPIIALGAFVMFSLLGDWFTSLTGINPQIFADPNLANGNEVITGLAVSVSLMRFVFVLLLFVTSAVSFGPLECGITYVCRSFVREKHTYVWKDLVQHMKANIKQGIATTFINLGVVSVLVLAFGFYYAAYGDYSNIVTHIITGLIGVILLLYLCISMYVYPIMITYDMSVKDIYYMAYIMVIKNLFKNIILIIAYIVILGLSFMIQPIIGALLLLFIFPATLKYVTLSVIDSGLRDIEDSQED